MFTTGSKFFFGATLLSIIATVVYAVSTGGPTGLMGTIGLVSVTLVFGFLAGINFFNRDGNVPALEQGAELTSAAAQAPVGARIGGPRAGFWLRGAAQRHEPDAQTRVDPARIATAAATRNERRRQEVKVDPG